MVGVKVVLVLIGEEVGLTVIIVGISVFRGSFEDNKFL